VPSTGQTRPFPISPDWHREPRIAGTKIPQAPDFTRRTQGRPGGNGKWWAVTRPWHPRWNSCRGRSVARYMATAAVLICTCSPVILFGACRFCAYSMGPSRALLVVTRGTDVPHLRDEISLGGVRLGLAKGSQGLRKEFFRRELSILQRRAVVLITSCGALSAELSFRVWLRWARTVAPD